MQGQRDRFSLSLVIPAYNEAAGIRAAIEEADQALPALCKRYEILIIDDGSSDETFAVACAAARGRREVVVLRHPCNRGYGAALRTGFTAARHERVAFTDADCQFHLSDLNSLLCLSARYPVVVGYRVDRQDAWRRRFLSWGYNVLTRALLDTGVRDCDCALKVFHRQVLGRITPESDGFFVNTEMLSRARQLGLDIAEVGVRHRPRRSGASKVSLLDIPRTLAAFLPFWWKQVLKSKSRPDRPRDLPLWLGLTSEVKRIRSRAARDKEPLAKARKPRGSFNPEPAATADPPSPLAPG